MSLLLIIGGVTFSLILMYVWYMSRSHGVLRKLGIPGPKPTLVFGNFLEEVRTGLVQYHTKTYNQHLDHKVYGFYRGKTPFMVVRDLDMIRDISVKKFNCFVNRNSAFTDEPLNHSLNEAKDDHWKNIRSTVSPTFNATRLKRMCHHFQRNTKVLLAHLQATSEANKPIDLKDICTLFAMDNIASSGFGVQTNSIKDPDNDFARESKRTLANAGRMVIVTAFFDFMRPILKLLDITGMPRESISYFKHFVDEALASRKSSRTSGAAPANDFLQLLLESEDDASCVDDNRTQDEADNIGDVTHKRPLSYNDIQGQSLVFILAGFETVSTSMSFSLFLLAVHPECLREAQEEIDRELDGEFPDYDNIQKLKYLDMCLNESLRLFSPGFLVDRVCNTECEVQGYRFPKGISVMIPICAIHRDPSHWSEPDEFRPSRFTSEVKATRHPYAHMPFGHGPRNCIGMRLGLLELKVAIAAVLQKFSLVSCDQTVYPVDLEPFRMMAKDGLWVKLEPRM